MTQTQCAAPLLHSPSLDGLTRLVQADMQQVNTLILAKSRSEHVSLISDLAAYIISSGGKRIRPCLTLACAQLCDYHGTRHIALAACVEFIHTATLLHDDVVDESSLRRGKATANEMWDNASSVLVGDFLFSRAFQLMVEDGSLDVLKILSDAAAIIAEGEVHQLMIAGRPDSDEATYLRVIEAKTAALFAAAAQIGAVVSENPAQAQALYDFGFNFGIAFQLIDDALDYSAKEADLGKHIGDDFREGKITLPVILSYQQASDAERAFFDRTLGNQQQNDADLSEALTILARHDAIAKTRSRAEKYAKKARESLAGFDASAVKDVLLEVLDFCVSRNY